MREIKLKCYILDKDGNVDCYFHEWLDGDGWKHDYYAPLVTNRVFSHEELGDGFLGRIVRVQYTGLKDKNGVEIYEGDIFKSPFFDENVSVEWNERFAQFTFGGAEFNVEADPEELEILGNIYEHPHLLNQ